MNALLLDACNFAQSEAEGFKCKKTLQMNEFKLFATSIGFINTTALTHLSYNVVPNSTLDLLYHPDIKRGTLTYLNRIRVIHIEDNDTKQKIFEKEEELLRNPPAKKPRKNEAKAPTKNLWGQDSEETKELIKQLHEQKMRYPSLHDQLERIVTESPRIEHFSMKWYRLRKDKVTHQINRAFVHLQTLSILRTLYIGTCTFDYVYLVNHLPPFIEQLTLRTTYCSSYKETRKSETRVGKKSADDEDAPLVVRSTTNERVNPDELPTFPRFAKAITERLPRLKLLRMHEAHINGKADFTNFINHPSLTTIIIHANERFSKQSFDPATLPPTLLHFRMSQCEMRGQLDFAQFPPSLTHLDLTDNQFKGLKKGDTDLTVCPPNLIALILDSCSYLKIPLPLDNLPRHLEQVDLDGAYTYGSFEPSKLPVNLKRLTLSKGIHSDGTVAPLPVDKLAALPASLRCLELRSISFNDGIWSWNYLPPLLESLILSGCVTAHDADKGLNLAALPCAETIRILKFTNSTGAIPWEKLTISSKPKNLIQLIFHSCGFDNIVFANENGEEIGDQPSALLNKKNAFPQNLKTLNFNNRKTSFVSVKQEIFDLSLLPDSLRRFRAFRSHFGGVPNLSNLPRELRVLDLSGNKLSFQSSSASSNKNEDDASSSSSSPSVLKLDSLPPRLRVLNLEENELGGSRIILGNLGSHIRDINVRKNRKPFDLSNSTFDLSGAKRLKHLRVPEMKFNQKTKEFTPIVVTEKKKKKRKRRYDSDSDSDEWSDSDSADSSFSDSDDNDFVNSLGFKDWDVETGWPTCWIGEDEKYGDHDDTTHGSDGDDDEWTSEYTDSSTTSDDDSWDDDDDDDDSWNDDDDDDDSSKGSLM